MGQVSENLVIAFLDKENRPNAQIITESFVFFEQTKTEIKVEGTLGAIESESKPDSFVAFSGVEIDSSLFSDFTNFNSISINLNFSLLAVDNVKNLSVQLVLKNGHLFALDLPISSKIGDYNIPLTSFQRSFRGKLSDDFFQGNLIDIKSVRFYLKRSENNSLTKEPVYYRFTLRQLSFKGDQ